MALVFAPVLLLTIFALVLLTRQTVNPPVPSGEPESTESHPSDVETCYRLFEEAVRDKNGERAADLVTESTLKWMSSCARMALHKPEDAIRAARLPSRVLISQMRHYLSAEQLHTLREHQFVALAITQQWAGFRNAGTTLARIKIDGTTATGVLALKGEESDRILHLRKERSSWKIAFDEYLDDSEKSLRRVLTRNGEPENEALLELLSQTSGRPVRSDIWKPFEPKP